MLTLEGTVAVQTQQIAELKPKASYYDVVLNCKDLLSVTEIAKDYGKSAVWFNNWMHEHGIQFKQGKIWLLYQKYAEQGYTSTKTQTFNGNDGEVHTKVHTYWTQKCRLFLYDMTTYCRLWSAKAPQLKTKTTNLLKAPERRRGKSAAERQDFMNEKNIRARDVPPEKLKAAIASMSLADKLMTSGLVQIKLAFEVAKSAAATEEEKGVRA